MFLFENIYTRTRYKTKTWKEKKDRKRKKNIAYITKLLVRRKTSYKTLAESAHNEPTPWEIKITHTRVLWKHFKR